MEGQYMLVPRRCSLKGSHMCYPSRRYQAILAQLGRGHCRHLAAYHNIVDSAVDPICRKCGAARHTLEHCLYWYAHCMAAQRLGFLGTTDPPAALRHCVAAE